MDYFLRKKTFNNREDVQNTFASFIKNCESWFFKDGINKLIKRWESVVDENGDYFD